MSTQKPPNSTPFKPLVFWFIPLFRCLLLLRNPTAELPLRTTSDAKHLAIRTLIGIVLQGGKGWHSGIWLGSKEQKERIDAILSTYLSNGPFLISKQTLIKYISDFITHTVRLGRLGVAFDPLKHGNSKCCQCNLNHPKLFSIRNPNWYFARA